MNTEVTTTADSGEGSLRDAVENIKTTNITAVIFNIPKEDTGYDPASGKWTIRITGGELKFRKPLTIKGGGKIILDGNYANRIFAYHGHGTLMLEGLDFKKSKTAGSGGAVCSDDALTVTDCAFSDNRAGAAGGGAIYASGAITVTRCTFSGNSAEDGSGGAVCTEKSTVTAAGCTFSGNSARLGGAINADCAITVVDCTFSGNTASDSSGAVYSSDAVTATRCVFSGNAAEGHGGTIYASGDVTLVGCTFSGNSANGIGGALGTACSISATDCAFTGNTARDSSGAMYAYGTVTLAGCIFSGNSAREIGGAVFAIGSVTAAGCAFFGNSAHLGGAVCVSKGCCAAINSSFVDNRTGGKHSGVIHADKAAYLYHVTLADNSGIGVYIRGDGDARLYAYNSVIAGNGRSTGLLSANDISGTSLIEGVTNGMTRASVFGEGKACSGGTIKPLADGRADKTADALTVEGITVPDGVKAADVIAVLQKDISGTLRLATGKVSYGAKEG